MTDEDNRKETIKKMENLTEYIDRLFAEMKELFAASRRWMKIEMMAMFAFIISIFATNNAIIIVLAFNLWFILFLFRGIKVDAPLNKKFGEIDGVFNTLRILGMLDDKPSGKKEKKDKWSLVNAVKETFGRLRLPIPKFN